MTQYLEGGYVLGVIQFYTHCYMCVDQHSALDLKQNMI